jgi:hypothetical protein
MPARGQGVLCFVCTTESFISFRILPAILPAPTWMLQSSDPNLSAYFPYKDDINTDLERLLIREGVTITARQTSDPPPPNMQGWTSWMVVIKCEDRRMKTSFYTEDGYEPQAADVISSLCSEVRSLHDTNGKFEEWAVKNGLNPDSRTAYATWESITKSSPKFKEVIGKNKFRQFALAKHR